MTRKSPTQVPFSEPLPYSWMMQLMVLSGVVFKPSTVPFTVRTPLTNPSGTLLKWSSLLLASPVGSST